jgi:hypothetical protein
MSATNSTADRRTCTSTEQPAADRALRRVVGVGAARQGQYQSHGDPSAGD